VARPVATLPPDDRAAPGLGLPPGPPSAGGRRWVTWLAPAAAAAGVALAVALAAILAGAIGRRAPSVPVTTGAGQPRYHVQHPCAAARRWRSPGPPPPAR
jgi:hypothetical protein